MKATSGQKFLLTAIALKTISSLAILKITAFAFGTTGVALLAHFQNLIGIITHLSREGINRGVNRLIYNKKIGNKHKERLILSGFFYSTILQVVSLVIIFLFNSFFLKHFNLHLSTTCFYLIFGISVLVYGICIFLSAIIYSLKKLRFYLLINIAGAILLLASVVYGSQQQYLDFFLLAYAVGQAANFIVVLWVTYKAKIISRNKYSISKSTLSQLSGMLLMTFSVLLFTKLVDFLVRDYAIEAFGLHYTGIWQAVVKLSDTYIDIFIATVGSVYYPKISSLIFNSNHLRRYLREMLSIVLPFSIIGLLALYFLRDTAILVFFNEEFKDAAHLFRFQLIGDFFSIISYLLTFIIVAQARTVLFILLQAGSAIFYIGLVVLLSQSHSIEAIPLAHAIRYGLFLVVLIVLNKRILL